MEGNRNSDGIEVYTDGGCTGNPGPGGWGMVVINGDEIIRRSGSNPDTTNNRMELTAAIEALATVAGRSDLAGRPVTVHIDSQYVKSGITQWIRTWKKNGWRSSTGKSVKNQDLWAKLDELHCSIKPTWVWVKGHSGVEYNEMCDKLCQAELDKFR